MQNKVGDLLKDKSQLVRGILEGCILKIIGNGETYGYEIVETLRTEGFEAVNEGTVYPLLMRLEKNGWIAFRKQVSPQGPHRKYYRLTEAGIEELDEFEGTWSRLKRTVDRILNEGE